MVSTKSEKVLKRKETCLSNERKMKLQKEIDDYKKELPRGSLQHNLINVVERFKINDDKKDNKIKQSVAYNDPTASLLHV